MKAPGIVSTQAHITRPATPHRTRRERCVVPTPTIAPVIVCVVDTGTPAERGQAERDRGGDDSDGHPADRLELRDLRAHRVHDPPPAEQRAEPDREVRREHHPQRDVRPSADTMPLAISTRQDDAHRLLRVVRRRGRG